MDAFWMLSAVLAPALAAFAMVARCRVREDDTDVEPVSDGRPFPVIVVLALGVGVLLLYGRDSGGQVDGWVPLADIQASPAVTSGETRGASDAGWTAGSACITHLP